MRQCVSQSTHTHTHRQAAWESFEANDPPKPNLSDLVIRIDAAIAEGREAELLAEHVPVSNACREGRGQ